MEKQKLLYKLTGTETPRFISEREDVIIDKCLVIINDLEKDTEQNAELLGALIELVECDYTSGTHLYTATIKARNAIKNSKS